MATPESKIKTRVRKLLTHERIWQFWPAPSGMQQATFDVLCVIKRYDNVPVFFMVETKSATGKLTPRQNAHKWDMQERLKVKVFVVKDDDSLVELGQWINSMLPIPRSLPVPP